jgi:hypothetical protein
MDAQGGREHIFGTIKRVWGFNHTNLKGLKKVNGALQRAAKFWRHTRSTKACEEVERETGAAGRAG